MERDLGGGEVGRWGPRWYFVHTPHYIGWNLHITSAISIKKIDDIDNLWTLYKWHKFEAEDCIGVINEKLVREESHIIWLIQIAYTKLNNTEQT